MSPEIIAVAAVGVAPGRLNPDWPTGHPRRVGGPAPGPRRFARADGLDLLTPCPCRIMLR